MKDDGVEILLEVGDGTRSFEIVATNERPSAGVTIARGTVDVAELTRDGHGVRSARFMGSRVVAVVEHLADEAAGARGPSSARSGLSSRGPP
jgi:hypothetical protein